MIIVQGNFATLPRQHITLSQTPSICAMISKQSTVIGLGANNI